MKRKLIGLGLTGLAVAAAAHGQQQQPPAQLSETLVEASRLKKGTLVPQDTTTATKTDTPIIELPQSISTVNRAEMDQRGAETVAEAVRYTPGVITGIGGEDSRVDDITIRGFEAGGFTNNVYLDGLRVPAGGQWTRVQYDPFGLESVDILKGPSSVLYGQVAPGGLVNQTSKRPLTEARNFLGLRYGSFDTWQASGDFTGPLDDAGRFTYRIAGLYREGDAQIDHTELSRIFIAPSLTWHIAEDTSLTLLSSYQRDDGGATYQFLPIYGTLENTPFGRIDRDTFIGEPDFNTYDRDQWTAGYEFNHRFNETWSLTQNARYASVDTFYQTLVAGRLPPAANGDMTRRAVQGEGDAWNVTMDTRLEARFTTGPVKHQTFIGIDQIWSEWNHRRTGTNTVPSINIFDPVHTGLTAPLALQVSQDVHERQTGAYLQDQMEIDRWRITAGLRYDWAHADLRTPTIGATAAAHTVTDEEQLTGRIGALYLFDNGIAPYASYATSFESVTGADYFGNAFDPTEGKQYEIGVKYQPRDFNALFTLSAFHLTQQNVLTPDPFPTTTGFFTQTGEIQIRGVELESKLSLTDGLSLTGGLTWLDSEVTRSNISGEEGKPKGAIPRHMASLWLDYTVQHGFAEGLGAGIGTRYIGSRYGANAAAYRIPAVTLMDAAIRYDLGKLSDTLTGTTISLNASNLFDRTYVAKAETLTSANYGPGRVISLSLNHTW